MAKKRNFARPGNPAHVLGPQSCQPSEFTARLATFMGSFLTFSSVVYYACSDVTFRITFSYDEDYHDIGMGQISSVLNIVFRV